MDIFYNEHELIPPTYEIIPLYDDNTIKTILENIKFNYLLIIFSIGCFTSLLYYYKRPIIKNKYLIVPSYDKSLCLSEGTPILNN